MKELSRLSLLLPSTKQASFSDPKQLMFRLQSQVFQHLHLSPFFTLWRGKIHHWDQACDLFPNSVGVSTFIISLLEE